MVGLSAVEPERLAVVGDGERDVDVVDIVRVELIEACIELAVEGAGSVEVGLSESVVGLAEVEDDHVVLLHVVEAVWVIDELASSAHGDFEGLMGGGSGACARYRGRRCGCGSWSTGLG